MADVQDTQPWSQCSPGMLLDMAQDMLDKAQGQYAAVLVAAAHVKALQGLSRTLADKRFI